MIRLVIAVALLLATMAIAIPAITDATQARTTTKYDAAVNRIERAGHTLVMNEDATRTQAHAATRRVEITIPAESFTTPETEFVAIGGSPETTGNQPIVTYALAEMSAKTPPIRRVISLPVPIQTPQGPVVFRLAGSHSITLSLIRERSRTVIVITRGYSSNV